MGREARMVPSTWEHPKKDNGNYIPLLDGYNEALEEFTAMYNKQGLQETIDYMGAPDKNDYMPDFPKEERTHIQMYEDTSEGTPISPPIETPEKLARWLVDNNASAFGNDTASYEGWLNVANGGYAPSMVISGGVIRSGVEAFKD